MRWKVGEGDPYALLASLLEWDALPPMARLDKGKPWFPDNPKVHFNVSHSRGLGLCAVSDHQVGADVETVRPRRKSLPEHVLDGRELEWFRSRGEKWEDFYTLWTMKEARVKCTGEGLQGRARDIPVPLLEPGQQAEWEGFTFWALAGEGWRGAVCELAMS